MAARVRSFRLQLGRRGLVLVLFGVIYALIGVSYCQGTISSTAHQNLHLALRWLPIQSWGAVWVAAAAIAVVASRWPPGRDWWGYAVLSGLSIVWGAFCVAGRVLYGAPYGLSAALLYGCLTAALLIIASWPEVR